MKKMKFLLFVLIFLLFIFSLLKITDNYFSSRTTVYLEQAVTYAASDIYSEVSGSVADFLKEEEILIYKYGKEDQITSAYVNTVVANQVLTVSSNVISNALKSNSIEERLKEVKIPLGQLISESLFASFGPLIPIQISPIYSYTTDLITESIPFGINSTIVNVYVKCLIDIEAFIPLQKKKIALETNVLIVSLILNGNVPLAYLR